MYLKTSNIHNITLEIIGVLLPAYKFSNSISSTLGTLINSSFKSSKPKASEMKFDVEHIYFLFCILCIMGFLLFGIYIDRRKNLWHLSGPFPWPLVGNALLFAKPPELFLDTIREIMKLYASKSGVARIFLGNQPIAFISSSEGFEKIMSSYKHTNKVCEYKYFFLIFE